MNKLVLLLGLLLICGCVGGNKSAESDSTVPSGEIGLGVNTELPALSGEAGVNVSSETPNITSESLGDAI